MMIDYEEQFEGVKTISLEDAIEKFDLDEWEVNVLNNGGLVWAGKTALTPADEEAWK